MFQKKSFKIIQNDTVTAQHLVATGDSCYILPSIVLTTAPFTTTGVSFCLSLDTYAQVLAVLT